MSERRITQNNQRPNLTNEIQKIGNICLNSSVVLQSVPFEKWMFFSCPHDTVNWFAFFKRAQVNMEMFYFRQICVSEYFVENLNYRFRINPVKGRLRRKFVNYSFGISALLLE